MYSSVYIYPVPGDLAEQFERIQLEALQIYREHGAIDDATYRPVDVSARYGCLGFDQTIELREGEDIWISVSFFSDRAHHDEVMATVDKHPRIDELFEEILQVVDVSRMARGEFERVV